MDLVNQNGASSGRDPALLTAYAFGELLRRDPDAAAAYDGCTAEQRRELLLRLDRAEDIGEVVRHLKEGR